jgi:hypothetical protein
MTENFIADVKNLKNAKISILYPALIRCIETENLELDDASWHHLVEYSIMLLQAASDLLRHFDTKSDFSSDIDKSIKYLLKLIFVVVMEVLKKGLLLNQLFKPVPQKVATLALSKITKSPLWKLRLCQPYHQLPFCQLSLH